MNKKIFFILYIIPLTLLSILGSIAVIFPHWLIIMLTAFAFLITITLLIIGNRTIEKGHTRKSFAILTIATLMPLFCIVCI